jgi:hypothetical protein
LRALKPRIVLRAALAGGDTDTRDVAQGVAQGGAVLFRHHLLAYHVDRLRQIADGFGILGNRGGEYGGGFGNINALTDAVEFQHHRIRAGKAPAHTGIFQHAFERLVRSKDTGDGVAGELADALVGH